MSEVLTDINYLPRLDEMGLTNSNLVQIQSARSVGIVSDTTTTKSDNFLGGVMDYSWSCADKKMVSMSRSYFRGEVEVTIKEGGVYRQAKMTDNFTLAENFFNNMIANSYFYIGSQSVCQLTQHHGQASMLRIRLNRSYNWLRSIGKSVYWLDPDFESRQRTICSDYDEKEHDHLELGYDDDNKMEVANGPGADESTVTFTVDGGAALPTGGIWRVGDSISYTDTTIKSSEVVAVDATGQILTVNPSQSAAAAVVLSTRLPVRVRDVNQVTDQTDGKNSIQVCFQLPLACFSNSQVYPSGQYRLSIFPKSDKTGALETTNSTPGISVTDVAILVKNLYLFVYVFEAESPFSDGTYYLSYNSLDMQAKRLIESPNATTTHTFNIPSSTLGIACFVQDTSAGTATALNCPPSVYKNRDSSSENLTNIQLVYSHVAKPVQLYNTELSATTQEMVQRYYQTQISANLDTIGGESFDSWLTRGGLYYFSFVRPSDDKATDLQIQVQMASISNAAPSSLFVCSFYRKLVEISVDNGVVSSVRSLAV